MNKIRHGCLALGLALSLAVQSHAEAQVPSAAPGQALEERATDLLWWGDFEALERLHAEVSGPGRREADGVSSLAYFRAGVRRALKGRTDAPDAYFKAMDALTLHWTRVYPQSPLAYDLHARALEYHAWSYRGTGFANAVPPDAWEDFGRYLRQATDFLARHADVALRGSDGHLRLMSVGRASGWPPDRLWAIAEQGLKLNPDDDALYFEVLTALLPKWGGSAQAVDRYIQRVTERTRATRGLELYARLYSAAASEQFQHALFQDSGAQWALMKEGYEGMLARHPDPRRSNRLAYFACLARDKPTFLDLMDRIGEQPARDQWGTNPTRTLETCRRWAAQQ